MAKKGQIFSSYSLETKKKAIDMRLQGMTKREVAAALGITDIGRLKVWMRKYREQGESGLIDQRKRVQEIEVCEDNTIIDHSLGSSE